MTYRPSPDFATLCREAVRALDSGLRVEAEWALRTLLEVTASAGDDYVSIPAGGGFVESCTAFLLTCLHNNAGGCARMRTRARTHARAREHTHARTHTHTRSPVAAQLRSRPAASSRSWC